MCARLGEVRHRVEAPEFSPGSGFDEIGGQLVPRKDRAGGYHTGRQGLELGSGKQHPALFSRTIAGPQAVSPYGSVAQLDRALASGARGRAFESRRAHAGASSPACTSVRAGVSFSPRRDESGARPRLRVA
jgi:hypothetical protein